MSVQVGLIGLSFALFLSACGSRQPAPIPPTLPTQPPTPITQIDSEDISAPVALAFVCSSVGVMSGTPNVTSTWDSKNLFVVVTIDGEEYSHLDYITVVTPVTASIMTRGGNQGNVALRGRPVSATIIVPGLEPSPWDPPAGKLVVRLFDREGNLSLGCFSFVTYRL